MRTIGDLLATFTSCHRHIACQHWAPVAGQQQQWMSSSSSLMGDDERAITPVHVPALCSAVLLHAALARVGLMLGQPCSATMSCGRALVCVDGVM